MTAVLPIRAGEGAERGVWMSHVASLSGAVLCLVALFANDAGAMVSIWWRSATFNHCLLIPPIIFWLVWQRLPELKALAPRAWAGGLVVVAAGGLAWLIGEAGGVALFRHAALVLMLQGSVVAILGRDVSRALAFPIFYALFLIPASEELVAPLQTLTARMSMALLALTGVPAHIEGIFISTPGGLFRVAEACSGLRFLVAMIAYGALVANLCFRSWPRRIAFLAASILVPILANGLRAFGTIWVAQGSGQEAAVGFDHIVYGWIFFAIVIALLMAGAWRFFDQRPGDPWFDPAAIQAPGTAAGSRSLAARIAAAAVAIAALPPLWTGAVAALGTARAPAELVFPQVRGWTRAAALPDWEPRYEGADLVRVARYRNTAGRQVDLAFALFAHQEEGRELVGYGRGASSDDGPWSWVTDLPAPEGAKAERIASKGSTRDVVTFYRLGNTVTGSVGQVKLETLRVRLLGGPQRAVAVLVSGADRASVDAFLQALGPVAPLADRVAGLPQRR